jgi:hypothetical protein
MMQEPDTSVLVSVKTNGTGSIRQFAQKATRLKLPSGLLALGTAKKRWNLYEATRFKPGQSGGNIRPEPYPPVDQMGVFTSPVSI